MPSAARIGAAAALAALAGILVAHAPAASGRLPACAKALLADWRDGLIDRSYARGCYEQAATSLPTSLTPVADELRAELAESTGRLMPADERGRRGGPRDPCPTLDQVAPCPLGIAPLGRSQLLTISGAIATSSRRALYPGGQNDCGYRAATDLLLFESAPMSLTGRAVARVSFQLRPFHGRGRYDATTPPDEYGQAPLQMRTGANATIGIDSGVFLAVRGSIRVSYAHDLGRRGRYGFAGGTVAATLIDRRTHRRISLNGSWVCSAEPVANGPS